VRNTSPDLVGKPEYKRSLERLSRRWKGNIKTYLRETVSVKMLNEFIWLNDNIRWRTVVNVVINLRVS
jgi:hypothetical protein